MQHCMATYQSPVLQRGAVDQRQVCEPSRRFLRIATAMATVSARCSSIHQGTCKRKGCGTVSSDLHHAIRTVAADVKNTLVSAERSGKSDSMLTYQSSSKAVASDVLHDADVQLLQVAQRGKLPAHHRAQRHQHDSLRIQLKVMKSSAGAIKCSKQCANLPCRQQQLSPKAAVVQAVVRAAAVGNQVKALQARKICQRLKACLHEGYTCLRRKE